MNGRLHVVLDVDGVINAVGDPAPAQMTGWSRDGWRVSEAAGYQVHWHPDMLAELRTLTDLPGTSTYWLTTWLDKAPALAGVIGLPTDWPVLGQEEHAADVPTAYGWWKVTALERWWHRTAQPGDRLLWVDDDIAYDAAARDWLNARPAGEVLTVSPKSALGLTVYDLTRVRRSLEL